MSFDANALRDAVDSMSEGMQVLSPEFRYLYVNQAAALQGRKPPSEFLGKKMTEVYPGIDQTPMFATLQRCMRQSERAMLENDFVYPDGTRGWFELRIEPCSAGVAILSVDITDRKHHEVRREEAHRTELRALETPVIRIGQGLLLVPVIGTLDAERAQHMMQTVLTRVVAERARTLILDVGGVPELDSAVAHHLMQTTAAVRLLGTKTILTGISAAAAITLVNLGVDLAMMQTTSDVAEAIALARANA